MVAEPNPQSGSVRRKVSLVAFFILWANIKRWRVPLLHFRILHWLATRGRVGVLKVFRGAAKSTLVAIYEAWRIYSNGQIHFLNQSADDATAYKISRDVRTILLRHPLCVGILDPKAFAVKGFSVIANQDARNHTVTASGILSNVTSSRADEVVNDDVEVPKNIRTPEAREKLRERLSEQTHIITPDAPLLFIGTPHTHKTIYDEQVVEFDADLLEIPLFADHRRFDSDALVRQQTAFSVPFPPAADGYYVFRANRMLDEGRDYLVDDRTIVFSSPPGASIDVYARCAWPERFTREEIRLRRRRCKTQNEWDSQYGLKAKPIHEIRLDPDRLIAYDVEPRITEANGQISMMLGNVRIVSGTAYWDPALGKPGTHKSICSLVLGDEAGNLYWHRAEALSGQDPEIQVAAMRSKLVVPFSLPALVVETNGPGTFLPPIVRKGLAGTGCGVREFQRTSSRTKAEFILDALETPIAGGFLWAHVSVLDGGAADEMRDWIPGQEGGDDFIDSCAGAIKQTPIRIGKIIREPGQRPTDRQDWRPSAGTHDVKFVRKG